MILKNRDGKIVGVVKKGVLIKKVHSRLHKLRIVDGYGIEEHLLQKAIEAGAKKIRVIETDTGKEFEADIKYFQEKAVEVNLGFGKQLALAGSYWREITGQESLL